VLDALGPHTSPGGAFIDIGNTATHYDLRAVYLETFARPLWGLTSLLAGGDDYAGLDRWVKGFASGTDPKGDEYWGEARAKDQRMVEMSPLSFAIALKPDVFYDVSRSRFGVGRSADVQKQTDEAKKNIAAFLETCIGKPMPDSERHPPRDRDHELTIANWLWFRVFANLALRSIGSPLFNPSQMDRDLSRLEEFQFEDHPPVGSDSGSGGWSNDGPPDVFQRDYYSSSFAIQFAQMTYAKVSRRDGRGLADRDLSSQQLCAESDPERSRKFRSRAQKFLLDFIYYFAPTGEAIPFGRSMVYRFAVIGSFSAFALADVDPPAPLEWGHIKGFVLRHLRSWSGNKEIFKSDGTLNIGYGYDNMNMTENYNAPGGCTITIRDPTELMSRIAVLVHEGVCVSRRSGLPPLLDFQRARPPGIPLPAYQGRAGHGPHPYQPRRPHVPALLGPEAALRHAARAGQVRQVRLLVHLWLQLPDGRYGSRAALSGQHDRPPGQQRRDRSVRWRVVARQAADVRREDCRSGDRARSPPIQVAAVDGRPGRDVLDPATGELAKMVCPRS